MSQTGRATKQTSHPLLGLLRLEDRDVPSATDLGIAQQFNAFIFDDYTGFNSDTDGRLAVGDDANLTNYGVGFALSNSRGTRDDLIVGDDLTFRSGQVFNGNLVYSDTASLTWVNVPNGTVKQASPINFSAASAELTTKSTNWGDYDTNGTITNNWGNLVLKGTNTRINIFNLTADQLQNVWSITVDAPAGSTVLINVSGTNVTLKYMGINVNGTDRGNVLWNFYEATQVTLEGVSVQGSILAPKAHIDFNNGATWGTVVARSVTGNGQFNLTTVTINIPESIPATISGTVFNDKNADGIQQTDEVGLEGVTVILTGTTKTGTSYYASTTTDKNGKYSFREVPAGTYSVGSATVESYILVSIRVGSQGGSASLDTGEILDAILKNATTGTNNDFGQRTSSGGGRD